MADIRINALANTASSSASDDFLALDGTTNGTRKLNAYSPSFGGNATVGGTLTVSGRATITAADNSQTGVLQLSSSNGGGADYVGLVFGTGSGPLSNARQWAFYTNYSSSGNFEILRSTSNTGNPTTSAFKIDSSSNATVGGNLTVSGGSIGTAASTNLALTGGSTGASISLGYGTEGAAKVNRLVQVTGLGTPVGGKGVEIGGDASNGYIYAYNRDGSASLPLVLQHVGGNVLIGKATPDSGEKLQVAGTAYVSGDATFAGTVTPTGGIVGVTTNSNAAAGNVGEYVSASDSVGVSLTTGTRANVVSISLTAGDWDVTGYVGYLPSGGASSTYQEGSISSTSATIGNASERTILYTTTTAQIEIPLPTVRVSLASTTTYYLVTLNNFTTGTMKGIGLIRARRVR